jgi:hypothetical protein
VSTSIQLATSSLHSPRLRSPVRQAFRLAVETKLEQCVCLSVESRSGVLGCWIW